MLAVAGFSDLLQPGPRSHRLSWCHLRRVAGLGEDQPFTEILPEVLRCYAKCVLHGHRHVYQALPRMLTIWFEHGMHCHASPPPDTRTQAPPTLT